MTWNLIEALTGIVTGDDWDSNGWGRSIITVKTHYPKAHGHNIELEEEIYRAFMVIRNLLTAVLSFQKFLYEFMNKL